MARHGELAALVADCDWMLHVLALVADVEPGAWVGAGVVRDLVWDTRFGAGFDAARVSDVDVAFFDARDLSRDRDQRVEDELARRDPTVSWEAKNQAAVHTWYPARFGIEVEPFADVREAVASWPETAACVAVRLGTSDNNDVEVVAPHGLDDLLDGVWRRNPTRVTVEEYRRRLTRKQPATRWPGVRVVPE